MPLDIILNPILNGEGPLPAATTTAVIEMVAESAEGTAPYGYVARIDPNSLSGFTDSPKDLDVKWDAYYTGSSDFDAPIFDKPVNMYDGSALHANGHRNSRYGYGMNFGHCHRNAGTYVLWAMVVSRDGTEVAYATRVITVNASSYPGTDTIFMSPSGDFTEAPAGAQLVTSADLGAAMGTYLNGQEATPKRIQLNRGETFTFSGFNLGSSLFPSCLIEAGSGGAAKPRVTLTGSTGFSWNDTATSETTETKDLTFSQVVLEGTVDFESDAYVNNSATPFLTLQGANTCPAIITVDDCEVLDTLYLVLPVGTQNGGGILFFDSLCMGYESGFNAYDSDILAIMGCRIAAPTLAYEDNTSNAGWALRTGAVETCIQATDFYTRQDWFGGPPFNGQASCRFNADQDSGVRVNLQTSCLEGGFNCFNNKTSGVPGTGSTELQVQKSFIIGTYRTSSMFHAEATGNTLEANIWVMPRSLTRKSDPFTFGQFDSASGNLFLSNTCINLNTVDQFDPGGGRMTLTTGTVTAENNLFHEPNTPTGTFTSDGPIRQVANDYFSPIEPGRLDGAGDDRANTATIVAAGEFDLPFPLPAAGAYQDATTGPVSYRDFTGRVRGGNPSRGALEN